MKAVFERAKVIVDGEDTYLCLSIPAGTPPSSSEK